jgi:hypothetical protein
METLAAPDLAHVRTVLARLADGERVPGLADLVNELNAWIGDGYLGVASPDDSPAFLERQLVHALRRVS